MKQSTIIIITIVLGFQLNAQSKHEISSLIDVISSEVDSSQFIARHKSSNSILKYGALAIPVLVELFENDEKTRIYSACQEKFLSKGEVAIILADRIERMPYAIVTRIQNCTLQFCENNLNLIEYYLWAIQRDGVQVFIGRYKTWFNSEERNQMRLVKRHDTYWILNIDDTFML